MLSYELGFTLCSVKGTSTNSNFFMRASQQRMEQESKATAYKRIHEDLSTELTQLSRKKCTFRGACSYEVNLAAATREIITHLDAG